MKYNPAMKANPITNNSTSNDIFTTTVNDYLLETSYGLLRIL